MGLDVCLTVDRPSVTEWYLRNRARSRAIFDLIEPAAYYSRPIALRNPIVFYEGHLPAFSVIALLRRGLGGPPVDARLEKLFERGIDPDSAEAAVPRSGASTAWPSRDEVLAFAARADAAMLAALGGAEFGEDRPRCSAAQALYTALEHEAMHQETLLYMWHRLPYEPEAKAGDAFATSNWTPSTACRRRVARAVRIPAGTATLGADREHRRFGWDNEFDEHQVHVPAFDIDVHNVTNARVPRVRRGRRLRTTRAVVGEGWAWIRPKRVTHPAFWSGSTAQWFWRGMFELIPLPLVVAGLCQPGGGLGLRAVEGPPPADRSGVPPRRVRDPGRRRARLSVGDAPPDATRGNFDFASWEPVTGRLAPGRRQRVGRARSRRQRLGMDIDDLRTVPGLRADGVVSGVLGRFFRRAALRHEGRLAGDRAASCCAAASATGSGRNYPYVYATFRTAASTAGTSIRSCVHRHARRIMHTTRSLRVRRRRPAGSRARAEADSVEVPVRRARVEPVRGDLPAAVVPHHARGERAARRARA